MLAASEHLQVPSNITKVWFLWLAALILEKMSYNKHHGFIYFLNSFLIVHMLILYMNMSYKFIAYSMY